MSRNDKMTLPQFIIDTGIVKDSRGKKYCTYHIKCHNEEYKDGLCKTHYNLGKDMSALSSTSEEGKLWSNRPILKTVPDYYTHKVSICSTEGCDRINTHSGLCYKCYVAKMTDKRKNRESAKDFS